MIKVPFGYLPGHWGLKGRTRERAKAEYELEGYELEKRLLEIDHEDPTEEIRKLDLKWGKITQYEYDLELAGDDKIAQLDVKLKHKEISEREHARMVADHKEEPYIEVLDLNVEEGQAGYVELEWNDYFIKMLHKNGYKGKSDEDIVNKWFNELCRTVLIQEMKDQDYGFEQVESDVIYRKDLENGTDSGPEGKDSAS